MKSYELVVTITLAAAMSKYSKEQRSIVGILRRRTTAKRFTFRWLRGDVRGALPLSYRKRCSACSRNLLSSVIFHLLAGWPRIEQREGARYLGMKYYYPPGREFRGTVGKLCEKVTRKSVWLAFLLATLLITSGIWNFTIRYFLYYWNTLVVKSGFMVFDVPILNYVWISFRQIFIFTILEYRKLLGILIILSLLSEEI